MKTWIAKDYRFDFPDEIRGTLQSVQFPAVAQVKMDGELGQLIRRPERIEIVNKAEYGRHRQDFAPTREAQALPSCTLIGEIYWADGKDFYELLRHRDHDALRFAVFDIADREGQDVRALSYHERWQMLKELFTTERVGHALHLVETQRVTDIAQVQCLFGSYVRMGYEGVVLKSLQMKLQGRYSTQMAKLKMKATADLAVLGFRDDRKYLSLILGHQVNQAWQKLCCVGTGFDFAEKLRVRALLEPLVIRRVKQFCYVKSTMVCEVEYRGFCTDGDGNKSLRMPVFVRWRQDKTVAQVSFDYEQPQLVNIFS